ncbi:MAG: MCP four helix bundle domain-containing protein, partial [Arcobacteraceae bacterium]|nr:MCP four helix bundle domain-containing protein [Arcobacteraceae bacterium]
MSIKQKLIFLIGTLLIGVSILGGFALYNGKSWSSDMDTIGNTRLPSLIHITNLNKERMIIRAQTLNVYAFENNYSANSNFSDIASQRIKSWEIVEENWSGFLALPRSKKGQELANKLDIEYKAWREVYVKLDDLITKLAKNTNPTTQQSLFDEYRKTVAIMVPISNTMGDTMDELNTLSSSTTNQMIKNAMSNSHLLVNITIFILIITIIVGITTGTIITKGINNAITLFQNGLIEFFNYLNRKTTTTSLIALNSNDEFRAMAELINENITAIQKNVEEDNQFIADTQTVMNRVANGWVSQHIQANSTNPALMHLKSTINEALNNLRERFVTINSVLEEYTHHNYTKKLFIDGIESGGVFETLIKDINKLQDTITQMLVENKSNGLTLDESSNILLTNVDKLNQSSNEAAASLEETAAALEQMTSNIRSNTENIAKMSSLASGVT